MEVRPLGQKSAKDTDRDHCEVTLLHGGPVRRQKCDIPQTPLEDLRSDFNEVQIITSARTGQIARSEVTVCKSRGHRAV